MVQLTAKTADLIADRFRALGEPMRLRILDALRDGELAVGELVEATGTGQANVSKHLQVLFKHGFVARRKEGTSSFYRIADPAVFDLCDMVCGNLREEFDRKRRLLR